MEIKFTGNTASEIREQLADWLQNLGGNTVQTPETPAAKKPEPAKKQRPAQKAETEPQETPAAKKKAEQETLEGVPENLDAKMLRKFCATAMKKGVQASEIISGISGGVLNLDDIDEDLYPQIYVAIKKARDELNA